MLDMNLFVLRKCLQQRLLPWLLHGLHQPFRFLTSFFLCTFPLTIVFCPIRSFKLLFLLNAMNCFSWKTRSNFSLSFNKSQCLCIVSLIFGNWRLYVTTHGILFIGDFVLPFNSLFRTWSLALLICVFISSSLYPDFLA